MQKCFKNIKWRDVDKKIHKFPGMAGREMTGKGHGEMETGRGGGGGGEGGARGGEGELERGQRLVDWCFMTPDLSKDIRCHILPYFF